MNAETQILKAEFSEVGKQGASAAIKDEISEVVLDDNAQEAETSAMGRRVNNIPIEKKFHYFHMVLIAMFGATLGSAILPLISESLTHFAVTVGAVIGLLGIALIVVAARAMKRDFTDPLNTLILNARLLANGTRDIDVQGKERGDEIGDLARTVFFLQKAGIKMDELYIGRKKADAERAENHAKRKSELREVASQFEAMVGKIAANVAAAASQLKATAEDMAKTAKLSSDQAQSVVEAMQSAAGSVASAASASDEFAMSIQEISRQAAQSEQLARETSSVAEGTDKTISELADSAAEISQIVELIQSIATRTNLLALNASIEAARGGESGRGFAVVASEVKELASRTSKATEDVGSKINAMQASTTSGVEKLHDIGQRVEELETTAIAIAAAVDQQSVAGKDLAHSIDLAARGTDEVSANASDLLDQANAVGSAADQLLSSARDLEEQAGMLTQQASTFLDHIQKD